MSWTAPARRFRSVAFRLTLFYTFFFGLISCLGLLLLYHHVASRQRRDGDQDLIDISRQLQANVDSHDVAALTRQFTLLAGVYGKDDCFLRIITTQGVVRASSDMRDWPPIPGCPGSVQGRYRTLPLPDKRVGVRILSELLPSGDILEVGVSLEGQNLFLLRLRETSIMVELIMLALGALFGWEITRRTLRGIENVTEVAARMAQGHLAGRAEVGRHGEEIDRLGRTFNQMADKIEFLMEDIRQTHDNIAHDLRSPVTRMRGMSEMVLAGGGSREEMEEALGMIIEECDRLLGLVNTLLDISEAEAGLNALDYSDVDLGSLMTQAADLFRSVAEARSVDLVVPSFPPVRIPGDTRKIQRILANLVDNAIKYSPAGGKVELILELDGDAAVIHVRDAGPGIPPADLPHIFTRFYRGDQSRSLQGNGLGLSLAQAFAKAHGGGITVKSGTAGSTFTVHLPRTRGASLA